MLPFLEHLLCAKLWDLVPFVVRMWFLLYTKETEAENDGPKSSHPYLAPCLRNLVSELHQRDQSQDSHAPPLVLSPNQVLRSFNQIPLLTSPQKPPLILSVPLRAPVISITLYSLLPCYTKDPPTYAPGSQQKQQR